MYGLGDELSDALGRAAAKGKSWTTPTIERELNAEEIDALRTAVQKLVEGNGHGRHLYHVRANDQLSVIHLDAMREWAPWMELTWKNMVELGTWEIFASDTDSEGATFLFTSLAPEPLDADS